MSDCNSEQNAARVLGYNQVMWDNLSGNETQPASFDKYWAELTGKERAAAVVLGYEATVWDNESGSEPQPASANKHWAKLTACGRLPLYVAVLSCQDGLRIYIGLIRQNDAIIKYILFCYLRANSQGYLICANYAD